MAILDDIQAYLVAAGVGVAPPTAGAWQIFLGYMPDDQDQVVGIFETGGQPRDTQAGENRRVSIMTRVRGPRLDYQAARNQWQAVFDALQDADQHRMPPKLPNFVFIQARAVGPIELPDNEGRHNLISNWRVMTTS